MEQLLPKLKLNHERLNASKLTLKEALAVPEITPRIQQYLLQPRTVPRGIGILGCRDSHYRALLRCKDIDADHICIIEDDVGFSNVTVERLKYISNILDTQFEKWDMLRIMWTKTDFAQKHVGWIRHVPLFKFNSVNVKSKFASSDKKINSISGGAYCTVINKKHVDKIIKYIEEERAYNIDSIYSTNRLNVFFVTNKDVLLKQSVIGGTSIPKIT